MKDDTKFLLDSLESGKYLPASYGQYSIYTKDLNNMLHKSDGEREIIMYHNDKFYHIILYFREKELSGWKIGEIKNRRIDFDRIVYDRNSIDDKKMRNILNSSLKHIENFDIMGSL